MSQSNCIFIGIAGTVLALDRGTGEEVWRLKLKGNEMVNVVLDQGSLYASAHGEVYCLDPATGAVRWRNELKGLGWGLVTFGTPGSPQGIVTGYQKMLDQAASG